MQATAIAIATTPTPREQVWRDYYSNPTQLAATLTDDFIAIDNAGGTKLVFRVKLSAVS